MKDYNKTPIRLGDMPRSCLDPDFIVSENNETLNMINDIIKKTSSADVVTPNDKRSKDIFIRAAAAAAISFS